MVTEKVLNMALDRRTSLRHPGCLPIRYRRSTTAEERISRLKDVGLGGIGFCCQERLTGGLLVEITVPELAGCHRLPATVLWCHDEGACFRAGARFEGCVDPFLARMLEQICHIEAYHRRMQEKTGQELSIERAALEWIDRFAARFPER